MPSIKDLRKSIVSVKNTQQTTRAMKMVSAAKLRRAQDAIQNQRPYARRMNELIRKISALAGDDFETPFSGRANAADEAPKKALLMLVTSDRGLCGGFNSSVIKAAQRWLKNNEDRYASVQLGFAGRKGYEFFKARKVNMGPYLSEVGGKVTFAKGKRLADTLVQMYLSGEVDEIYFVFNEFKNAVTQKVVVEPFLPLAAPSAEALPAQTDESTMYLVRPGVKQLLEQLLAKNFAIQSFRVLLESQAGEHGARMSSMENATKNAGEMIRKLTLQYNKQRQAGITKELLEIIAGSESQKG